LKISTDAAFPTQDTLVLDPIDGTPYSKRVFGPSGLIDAKTLPAIANKMVFAWIANTSSFELDLKAVSPQFPDGLIIPLPPLSCKPNLLALRHVRSLAAAATNDSSAFWLASQAESGTFLRNYRVSISGVTPISGEISLFLPSGITSSPLSILNARVLFQVNATHFVLEVETSVSPEKTVLLTDGVSSLLIRRVGDAACFIICQVAAWIVSPDTRYAVFAYKSAENSAPIIVAKVDLHAMVLTDLSPDQNLDRLTWTPAEISRFRNNLPVLFNGSTVGVLARSTLGAVFMFCSVGSVTAVDAMPEPLNTGWSSHVQINQSRIFYQSSAGLVRVQVDLEQQIGSGSSYRNLILSSSAYNLLNFVGDTITDVALSQRAVGVHHSRHR
jgi:hypothetical protein